MVLSEAGTKGQADLRQGHTETSFPASPAPIDPLTLSRLLVMYDTNACRCAQVQGTPRTLRRLQRATCRFRPFDVLTYCREHGIGHRCLVHAAICPVERNTRFGGKSVSPPRSLRSRQRPGQTLMKGRFTLTCSSTRLPLGAQRARKRSRRCGTCGDHGIALIRRMWKKRSSRCGKTRRIPRPCERTRVCSRLMHDDDAVTSKVPSLASNVLGLYRGT